MVVRVTGAAIWRWRNPGLLQHCFGPIFDGIFVTNDCSQERLRISALISSVQPWTQWWKFSNILSLTTAKPKHAFSWDSLPWWIRPAPEKRWQGCREDKMSGKKQNPYLLTSESKGCDLVSLFPLGCGLAKLPPCACRGDEPQPHLRVSQQPSCAEPGIIHAADHLP